MNELTQALPAPARPGLSQLERLLRGRLVAQLQALRGGRITLHDACGSLALGPADSALEVNLHVARGEFYSAVAARGSVGAGEAYMAGDWRCDDLAALVRILVRNRELLDGMEGGLARLGGWLLRGAHALRRNTLTGSRRNIAAHYDLGNDFFALFLSPDLMYSSAYWLDGHDTLEAASTRKLDLICRKLQLGPEDHVLEIGTGWGAFAMHAVANFGARVTTTTISAEQAKLARARIAAAGLSARVSVLQQDYRALQGSFDKLVSIEMVEAIGAQYLPAYFGQLGRLLRPGGIAVLQAITIEDHRYAQALKSVDFIKQHVFPGSFIPSIQAMLAAKTQASDLALTGLEDFGSSYARTLRAWRLRFLRNLPAVRRLGFDEQFIRMWEFYLAYCEGGFLERSIGVAHLVLAKPGCQGPRARGASLSI